MMVMQINYDTKDPVTVEDYKLVHDEFFRSIILWPKDGPNPKAEDVLKGWEHWLV